MALVLAVGSMLGFGPGAAAGASSSSAGLSPGCGSWKVGPAARVGHADLSSIAEVSPTDVWAVGNTPAFVGNTPAFSETVCGL
jgi:hypothetical protein